ncbi:EAL domain-containing protein [Saccharopolyspora shandongensis]|uniref:putative bifunctional diguanylate cyclase/phosphodiesterase n=1 Tax=Saccharopolyspora shandongensis TaxID=418495 RepID=UPI0033EBCDB8
MRLPDAAESRAVLIGAGHFDDPLLPDLPAVRNNLDSLTEILASPSGTGLPAENCTVVSDPTDLATLGVQLEAIAEQTEDVLLVYYAGHGLVDAKGRLWLALSSTLYQRPRWTALEFTLLRDMLLDTAAKNRVLILDCCFSGRAIEAMSDPLSVMSGQIEIAGTYTLTSAPANSTAHAPQGATYTAFTGELLDILRNGLPHGPQLLSFSAIYPQLVRALDSRGVPRPVQRGIRTADHLALASNPAYQPDAAEQMRHDAYHDPLTDLLNRTGFRAMTAEALRQGRTAVILRVDLDLLTTVSEALGYAWGDRLVVTAGRRMRETLGTEVPLARLEANSFAVLLVDHTESQAHELAEKLRAEIAEPYPADGLMVEATGVGGYASSAPADGAEAVTDVDLLLQRADIAVRAARNGEDGVRGYAPAMGQIFLRRFHLVTQFRQALDSGQVEVHYQPKVALPGRQVVGAEALVRWSHPEYGRLDPDEFVPVVEATGLADALTSFVMERAMIKVREWLDRGLRISAAVNLSVRNLADKSFPDRVDEALRRNNIPPELLTFELTESSVMADPERSLPVLRGLHAMGVVLAVDDFGAGYSSLAYLRQLPVDEVKIDKSFVLGMGTDLGDMAVVRSIVELGHSLDLIVVAEGVEEDAAWNQLVRMECDVAQGNWISQPLPEERLDAWLQQHSDLVW